MGRLSALLPFYEGNLLVGIPSKECLIRSLIFFVLIPVTLLTVRITNSRVPVIWDAMTLLWRQCIINYRTDVRDSPKLLCVTVCYGTYIPRKRYICHAGTSVKTNKSHVKHFSWLYIRCVAACCQWMSVIAHFVVHFGYIELLQVI